jgi:hypothetical protein
MTDQPQPDATPDAPPETHCSTCGRLCDRPGQWLCRSCKRLYDRAWRERRAKERSWVDEFFRKTGLSRERFEGKPK